MVHTQFSTVKKKKYVLPTSNNITNINNDSNDDSLNIVNTDSSIKVVLETQTQVVEATQNVAGYLATSEELREGLANLDDKMTDELEKTPVTDFTSGEKSSDENQNITTTPPSSKSKGSVDSCGIELPEIEILKFGYKTPEKKPFKLPKNPKYHQLT